MDSDVQLKASSILDFKLRLKIIQTLRSVSSHPQSSVVIWYHSYTSWVPLLRVMFLQNILLTGRPLSSPSPSFSDGRYKHHVASILTKTPGSERLINRTRYVCSTPQSITFETPQVSGCSFSLTLLHEGNWSQMCSGSTRSATWTSANEETRRWTIIPKSSQCKRPRT